ncbi:MAG TPA: hypothetical protein GX501_01055, partial [Clostridiaceae bacterium]|nr:hypothetical protein [Clostridiaceae bacterium]
MKRFLAAILMSTLPLNILTLYTGGYFLPAETTASQVQEDEQAVQTEEQPELLGEQAEEEVPETE